MRIFCLTSDKYIDAVRPFIWLADKYWQDRPEILVAGFTPPKWKLPPNTTFHSIGKFENYPVSRWSDALIKLLHDVDDEHFIMFLEDMWIVRPVYTEVVDLAAQFVKDNPHVVRFDLTGDRLNAGGAALYGKMGHVNLIWSDPNSQYHMSTMPAIWNRELLLRVLVPGETPWQVELQGTPRLQRMKNQMIVLGQDAWPIKNTLAFRGGDTSELLLNEIAPADVDEMRGLGLFEGLE